MQFVYRFYVSYFNFNKVSIGLQIIPIFTFLKILIINFLKIKKIYSLRAA